MRFRVRLSPSFVPKVEQGGPGMVKQHARAGVAHDGSHLSAHPGTVTMDGALLAGGFLFAVAAMREAGMGIFQKCLAGGAERGVSFFMAAIEPDHLRYYALLSFDV